MKTIKILRTLINILFYTLIAVFAIGFIFILLLLFFPNLIPMPWSGFSMIFNQPFGWKIYLVPVSTIVNYMLLIAAVFLLRKGTSSFLISDFYNEKVTTSFKKAGYIFIFIGISTIIIQSFTVVYVLGYANNIMQMKTNFLITIINTIAAAVDLKSVLSIIIGLFFMLFSKIFENSRLLKQENDLTI